MYSFICAENLSEHSAISVHYDDCVIFDDVLTDSKTAYRAVKSGSASVKIYDNYYHKFLDLWISVSPGKRYALRIHDRFADIIPD